MIDCINEQQVYDLATSVCIDGTLKCSDPVFGEMKRYQPTAPLIDCVDTQCAITDVSTR
jgi:hypothetical protein